MDWIAELLGGPPPADARPVERRGRMLTLGEGVVRDLAMQEAAQAQTRDMFAYKWARRDTYGSAANDRIQRAWLLERYGDLGAELIDGALVLDAGCGSGYTAKILFAEHLARLRYVGADISTAVDIAREELGPRARESFFLQGDLLALPFARGAFDLVFSEGVLHHTPSTRAALLSVAQRVKPGGLLAFYVYARKGPVREFTDDYIRARIADLPPGEAWEALRPLTALGKALGEADVEIDIPHDIDLLGVPKGRISVQRLFYYYVCKAYHRPEYGFEELNHINFDWFTPKYCHRQSPEEVEAWVREAGFKVRSMKTELSGITVVAEAPRR